MINSITDSPKTLSEIVELYVNQTNKSIFLTGKAGTGKTTLLKSIINSTHKRTVVVAPTGIAALNAGGVTIHSFFQLPFAGFIPEFGTQAHFGDFVKLETKETLMRHFSMNKERLQLIRNTELIIVDEVSMLRADLLDAIDWNLRNVRKINQPFGGVQMLFIGDLLQLPPVVKQEEWSILRNYYQGIHFFHSRVLQEQKPIYIELEKIYRQADHEFIEVLNNLRQNKIGAKDLEILNAHYDPDFKPAQHEGYVTLTTHNNKADEINERELQTLKGKEKVYSAVVTGQFPEHIYPIDAELKLKEGAQIMFIKNDLSKEKRFYNGKTGVIRELLEDEIIISFPEEKKTITIEQYEWENIKYAQNNQNEIEEETLGTFVQYPIKLAWAITIHKSQGLTFEKAVLDVSKTFAPGQAYVALSRLTSLKGLVLLTPFTANNVQNDALVLDYARSKNDLNYLIGNLENNKAEYLKQYLTSSFDWSEFLLKFAAHEKSYLGLTKASEKFKNQKWIINQGQLLEQTRQASASFRKLLDKHLSRSQPDYEFILERVDAAYNYFFEILDNVFYSVLKMTSEINSKKKTHIYVEELSELLEGLLDMILNIKRARILNYAICNQINFDKKIFKTQEIENYQFSKIEKAKQEMKLAGDMFTPPDFDIIKLKNKFGDKAKSTKEKSKKEPKGSTYEKTLAMLHEGLSLEEIAAKRQMAASTIETHFVNLIKNEKIELSDVLDVERISYLEDIFSNYTDNTLAPIKEMYPDLSWGELKMYQASKML